MLDPRYDVTLLQCFYDRNKWTDALCDVVTWIKLHSHHIQGSIEVTSYMTNDILYGSIFSVSTWLAYHMQRWFPPAFKSNTACNSQFYVKQDEMFSGVGHRILNDIYSGVAKFTSPGFTKHSAIGQGVLVDLCKKPTLFYTLKLLGVLYEKHVYAGHKDENLCSFFVQYNLWRPFLNAAKLF